MEPRASGISYTAAVLAEVGRAAPIRAPDGPCTTLTPVRVACTIGRPFSAARRAASEACWAGAQLSWKVEVADCATSREAPSRVRRRLMSGKADSKQTSGPRRTPVRPSGRPGRSMTTGASPRMRSSPAARPTEVAQPSSARAGTYSPKGTSRILS